MICNTDNVRKFIAALRSGKYKQGFGALRPFGHMFCALGVAYDVSGIDANTRGGAKALREWFGSDVTFEAEELGIKRQCLCCEIGVISLNDRYRWPFERIADAIEAKYVPEDVIVVPADVSGIEIEKEEAVERDLVTV